jgi:phosphoesterase RecJ-like protein
MLQYGAQFPKIFKETTKNQDVLSMKLWGLAMENLKINKKYNIAITVLTKKMIMEVAGKQEINNSVFGDVANYLGNLSGVKAVLFLREESDNVFRGNLRSSDISTDVSKIAQLFGGGGHPQASGFVVNGSINRKGEGWEWRV